MSYLLLVGSRPSSITVQIMERVRAQGYHPIVLADERITPPNPELGAEWICADFSSKKALLQQVNTLPSPIVAVMTAYENYVLSCAWINEYLGLPGMSEAAAMRCTDKYLMRRAFAATGNPISPDFAQVGSEAGIRKFAATHAFPLILKPTNLTKSLLVTKSSTLVELLANYRHTAKLLKKIYGQFAPDRLPKLIIEEYLEGTMHSVAGFAGHDGTTHILAPVVDVERAQDAGFDDNFLYARHVPSRLSKPDQERVRQCAQVGMQALDMRSSPAHVEIILTAKGPRIVEIGARNGGYRQRMYSMACGVDLLAATIDVACGATPNLRPTKDDCCAVLEFFPRTSGAFAHIQGAEMIASLASCVYFSVKATVGTTVGKAADGYKACAMVILHNKNKAQFTRDLAVVRANGAVVLQAA